jgi:hypothetical protein
MTPSSFCGFLRRLRQAICAVAGGTRTNRQPRRFRAEFEILEYRVTPSSNPLAYTAPAGVAHSMILELDATSTVIQIVDNGLLVASQALAGTSSVSISGANNVTNTLAVDFGNGNPIPVGGLDFNGGTGTSTGEGTLVLKNGSFTNEVDTPTSANAGSITLGATTIDYSNLAPIIDTLAVTNFTINAPKTADTINIINDPSSPQNGFQTTQVNSGTGGLELVDFANKTNVTVTDTSAGGDDTFSINNPAPANGLSTLTINASSHGTGSTFNVLATPATVTTNVNCNAADSVNVGNNHSVQNILGLLTVENATAHNTLTLDDAGDATARTVSFNTFGGTPVLGLVHGLAPADIHYQYGATSTLTVDGGTGGNSVTVTALPLSATVLNINGGTGTNTLTSNNLGNSFNVTSNNAGNLDGATAVTFSNIQNLNGGTGNDSFMLSNGVGVSGNINGGGGTDTLNYSLYALVNPISVNLQTSKATNIGGTIANIVNLVGGAGSDTLVGANTTNIWNITATNAGNINGTFAFSAIENLTGGTANDTFNFSNGVGVSGNINGGGGSDTLNYSQYAANDPITVNLQTSTATNVGGVFSNIQNLVGGLGSDTLVGPNTANTWNITASNAGNINGTFTFSSIENLTGGSGNDSYKFSNGVGVSGNVNGAGGTNTLDFSLYQPADPITVNLQSSTATNIGGVFSNIQNLIGGLGSNTLVGANTSNTWNITASNAGNINGTFTFSAIQNLTGGTGQDIFTFAVGGSVGGKINGAAGSNWLVYSAQTSSINVNLASGTASLVGGGVTNIQNVIGSANGGDTITGNSAGGVLVGHSAGNTITAGTGRSVIIGGFGRNLLQGRGNDIIIAGKTSYDANITALASILAEWANSSSYATRISLLKNGGGLNGTNVLVFNKTVFSTTTPPGPRFGRGGGNGQSTLVGNGTQNWFFTFYPTAIVDLAAGEQVN